MREPPGLTEDKSRPRGVRYPGRITEDNLFLRLEVNRSSLYVGESLVATLKVYSRVDLNGFGRTKFPAFDGFLAENVEVPRLLN